LQGSFKDIHVSDVKTMIHAHLNDLKLQGMDEFSTITNEMVRLIKIATTPILIVDSSGFIDRWLKRKCCRIHMVANWRSYGSIACQGFDFAEVVECLLYFTLQCMVLISYGIQFISFCSHM